MSYREKNNNSVKPTSKLFRAKMLMFAKISLESFTYELTETFFFRNRRTRKIYNKYMIERIFPYSVLTDTGSICVFFIFICKPESNLLNSKFRDILFKAIVEDEILHRFDTPCEF